MLLTIGATSAWAQSEYHSYSNIDHTYGSSSSLSTYNSDRYPTRLFDNDLSTKYCVVFTNNTWAGYLSVTFESNDLIIPTGYVIYTGDDTQSEPGRNPKNWHIDAKVNESDSWTTIHTVTNAGLPATNKTRVEYTISGVTTAYKYFRFYITDIVSGSIFQLQDFHFIATVQGGGEQPSVDYVEIGTGTSTTGYAPVYGNYKSSYAQMIYTAEQLQAVGITAAGTITKIGFNSSASNTYSRKPIIYIGHTDKTSFSSTTDFVSINDLEEVYNYSNHSQWNITSGWNEFELDTPFEYDGQSNIVIAMHCGLISNYSSSTFRYTSTTNKQVIYARSDSTDPIPSNYEGNWSSYGTSYLGTSEYLPNLRLYYTENIEEITIGDDASTSSQYYLPVNMYYKNSMTQQIFTADEIGTAGTIKSISFNCKGVGSSSNAKTVKVYMKHTDKETFSSNTDVVRMDATDMVIASFTLLPTATGWVKMTLDTPFEYDGQSNLLICCYDHSNQYPGTAYTFQTTATTGYTSIAYYSDSNYDYNPTGTLTTDGTEAYYQYRNNLKMEIVPVTVTCHKPSDLTLDAVSESSATISWTSDGSSFEYVYGTTGFTPDWSGTTYTTSNTSVQVTNLTASTGYDFYVRTVCGDDDYTNPAQLSFRTECGAITTFPWSEDFESYNTGNFSNPCWVNEHIEGSGTSVFQVSSSNNQTGSTHTLQLPDMSSGTMTKLVLPEMTIPSSGTYAFSIDVYRNASTSNYGEGIRVYASTNGNIEGATELGFISRSYTTADATHDIPAESASGWYTYTLPIPITGTCYIILRGESKYGSSTYMDNFGVASAFTISATANPTEGGTVSGADAYIGGSSCTLTATANRGYDFENWTKNGVEVSTDASFSFTVSEDAAYVANFTALAAYEITATANDVTMGTVTGAGTYYEGETCNLVATVNGGFGFNNWTENDTEVSTSASYSFIVDGDRTLVANFEKECDFYEDFEACSGGVYNTAADNMPSGWYAYTTGTGTNIVKPHVCNSGSYYFPANGGSHAVNLESGTNASSNKAYVVLPANESGQPYMRISFWYRQESSNDGYGTLKVGYVTEQSATGCNNFHSITSITPSTTLHLETVNVSAVPADAYLAFEWQVTNGTYYACGIDDICVKFAYTKTIAAYSNSQAEKGGYYLIASPLAAAIAPTDVDGMITDNLGNTATTSNSTYDLYSFNQAQELEWQNYRASNFNLVNGTGYLYASKEGTTLTFSGAPYSGTTKTVTLSKTAAATGLEFSDWNLVGNPFALDDAYITKSFYTLEDSDTYTLNTAGTAIHPMQGLLVIADEDGETMTFSTADPNSKVAKLNMNVTKGRAVVDQAIISFNEGQQLPKLQFRNGSTKVYLPKDGKEYAIVSTEAMGTMPVNFKAENDGTYTLSFTAEEVSFSYLHLIDNMTGEDVDLLAGASTGSATYTFDARTTDYESRFKLVFATGNNANDDAFAFYSNGSFVINNEGEATLQVIDMNGRILKSESINGCANVNVKAAAGVYMLRLVNGNDVKVQKVVVR